MLALFARFLRFGLLAWGGPVAQIAIIRRELVDQERWISSRRFNRLLAAYQVLPGPEATELAVHLGTLRGGRLGGLLAGLGFVLPGFVLVTLAAVLYRSIDLGQPAIAAALLGVQAAVIALVVRAVDGIGRHILVDRWVGVIAIAAGVATLAGVAFWIVLGLGALAYIAAGRLESERGDRPGSTDDAQRAAVRGPRAADQGRRAAIAVLAVLGAVTVVLVALGFGDGLAPDGSAGPGVIAPTDPTLPALFLTGLKGGLLTFGGAYTAIPFVREDAVGGGWITDPQFLDALALSGILPAPFIMFGAFVGYLAGGLAGAVVMTLAIFLPAFSFSLVLGDRLEAIVDHPSVRRALEGVAAGVVGIIAIVAIDLAVALAGRVPSLPAAALIVVAGLVLLYRSSSRLAIPLAIGGGAALGWLLLGGMA
ncbi:MAG TPA: chromate transporter [Candidatus Binatia bacterium]|nr:chromate transporter [Candidatus Binatia bacterium]